MKTKINKVFIGVCLLLLTLPLILVTIRVKVDDPYSSKRINGNFERNFPLKAEFFQVYAFLKNNIFHINSIPGKVIETKNGWLFCGDGFSYNLTESKGFVRFSNNELAVIKTNLLKKQAWLKQQGIPFFLAVAPNKETVYGHMIPILQKDSITKRKQIQHLCIENNINYIDLSAKFPKINNHNLYYKTDTHWTEVGGFYGHLAIMESLKNQFPQTSFVPRNFKTFTMSYSDRVVGDLNSMLKRSQIEKFVLLDFPSSKPNPSSEVARRLQVPDGYPYNPLTYERRFVTAGKDHKLLFFGDSFFPFMTKFITEHFGETVVIWNQFFDKDLIINEKPDIVIMEIVERNVDILLDY
ncbi:MAG: hypothetical protein H6584_07010 [Flavobacteriales bacterium]|nr:hypothetical protein [Flavobacteriales bacterium]